MGESEVALKANITQICPPDIAFGHYCRLKNTDFCMQTHTEIYEPYILAYAHT